MTTNQTRRHLTIGLAALALGAAATLPVQAQQDYPNKMVKIIVPFSAGGSSDVQARMLAERLGKLYKQSVIVENRPGAGGHIGGKAVVDAPADGYTLLLGSIGLHASYAVYKRLAYDPAKDLKIVTVLAEMPHVVVANPNLPAGDLKQLAVLAKQKPNTINFGSAGVGSSVHMIGELYRMQADAPIVHIPYKGSSAAINDLLGGQIQLMFENPPTVIGHVRAGKLKALAVTGNVRSPALPEVPTAKEAGMPGYEATSWTTVAVAAGVPDAIAEKLNADIRSVISTPEFRKGLLDQGMTPVGVSREEARKFVEGEKAKWEKVIRQGNISLE